MIKGRRTQQRAVTKRVWTRIYLLEWRVSRGLSVEGLAEKAGVSPGLISLIENRKSAGSPESLEKLANALDIAMGDLFEPPPAPDTVMVRAWVKIEDREQVEDMIRVMKGKLITN